MKTADVNKLMASGTSVLVGSLTEYEVRDTDKAGAMESFHVLQGTRILSMSRFLKDKRAKAAEMKAPAWFKPGVVVVFTKVSIGIEGKYLRTGFDVVEPLET